VHLGTLIHVSDLHIGTIDEVSGDAEARRLWAYSRAFHGLLGHEYRALDLLERFVRGYDGSAGPRLLRLIVSGDLTRVGHVDEFSRAVNYRDAVADFGNGRRLGLGLANEQLSIPGNHDRWPGASTVWGGPTSGFDKTFPQNRRPYWNEWTTLASGHTLRFIGIDTDADVSAWGHNRLLARGAFLTQLDTVSRNLFAMEPTEIRVLVMHHSPAHRGRVLGMQRASRAALADFVEDHGVAVILTGHLHAPRVCVDAFQHSRPPVLRLEARCGTTSVRRTLPYGWRSFMRRPDGRRDDNTLLVHDLTLKNGEVIWTASTYVQTPQRFDRVDPARLKNAEASFRAWPL
jgi:3',5'-cyclic AMP phosphodiesterase CpdA